jgi:hypothetical protein
MGAVARPEPVAAEISSTRDSSPRQLLLTLGRRPDFLLSIPVGVLILALLYYWLLLHDSSLHTMASRLSGQPIYVAALAVLAPATLLLFGGNLGLAALLVRARARAEQQGGSALGALLAAFGVGCPSCKAFLLSLVGVSAGLSALPFGGLELWFLSCVIMGFTFWRSLRALQVTVCDVSGGEPGCPALPPVSSAQVALLAVASMALAGILLWTVMVNDPL